MATFWAALAAYMVGWIICNVFAWQLVHRYRADEQKKREWAKLTAEEYFKLAHPEATPYLDSPASPSSPSPATFPGRLDPLH